MPRPSNALTDSQLNGMLRGMNLSVVKTDAGVSRFISDFERSYVSDPGHSWTYLEVIWNKDHQNPRMSGIVIWMETPDVPPPDTNMITQGWFIDTTRLSPNFIRIKGISGVSRNLSFAGLINGSEFSVFDVENVILAMGLCYQLAPQITEDLQVLVQAMRDANSLLPFDSRPSLISSFSSLVHDTAAYAGHGITHSELAWMRSGDQWVSSPPFSHIFERPLHDRVVYRHVFAVFMYGLITQNFYGGLRMGTLILSQNRLAQMDSTVRTRRDFALITVRDTVRDA